MMFLWGLLHVVLYLKHVEFDQIFKKKDVKIILLSINNETEPSITFISSVFQEIE